MKLMIKRVIALVIVNRKDWNWLWFAILDIKLMSRVHSAIAVLKGVFRPIFVYLYDRYTFPIHMVAFFTPPLYSTRALLRYKLKGPDFYDSVQVVIKPKFIAVMIFKQTGHHLSESRKSENCIMSLHQRSRQIKSIINILCDLYYVWKLIQHSDR